MSALATKVNGVTIISESKHGMVGAVSSYCGYVGLPAGHKWIGAPYIDLGDIELTWLNTHLPGVATAVGRAVYWIGWEHVHFSRPKPKPAPISAGPLPKENVLKAEVMMVMKLAEEALVTAPAAAAAAAAAPAAAAVDVKSADPKKPPARRRSRSRSPGARRSRSRSRSPKRNLKLTQVNAEVGCRILLSIQHAPSTADVKWTGYSQQGGLTFRTTSDAVGSNSASFRPGQTYFRHAQLEEENGTVLEAWKMEWKDGDTIEVDWKKKRLCYAGVPLIELA